MALEHFKTQVLLLHSQQSTLDVLSAGFNDRYSVHVATSGTEALNTLGDTPIHVIVSAQDLPGMSGLEALREAKKRSPDTIGILLAGTDSDDGLEALVGDKEVFQIVRGKISPSDLRELIDNATRQVRLLALSESANDQAANPDEPVGEHIVMETSENGSTIISDGTGRMPVLKPEKVAVAPNVVGRQVDVLVLTKDEEFLATVRDSARGLHNIHHANTPTQAEKIVKGQQVGVLVTDAAMVGSNIELLTQRFRKSVPRLVAVVAGRRDDGELLMDLINRGQVYRFLLKPVSPGRARLAIEASVKHHLEAADSAFKGKPKAAPRPAPKAAPKAAPKKSAKVEKQKSVPKAKAKPTPKPVAKATPAPITASPEDDRLSGPFDEGGRFTDTMTGLANSVGKSLSGASSSISGGAKSALGSAGKVIGGMLGAIVAPIRKPKNLAIAGGLLAVVGAGYWLANNWSSLIPETAPEESDGVAAIAESPLQIAEPEPSAIPADSGILDLLYEARLARESGQIVNPPGTSAIELYVAAISEAPDNPVALAELEDVVSQALGMTEAAMLEQRSEDAAEALQMVRLADPDNPRLMFLDAQLRQMQLRNALDEARLAIRSGRFEDAANMIGKAETLNTGDATEISALREDLSEARSAQQIDEVLALANERLNEDKLTTPSNDNARYYFELALSNDPGNPAAQQGMTIVASKLVLQARAAIDKEQFTLAGSLLRDAEALDSNSAELAASKQALDDARAQQEAERMAEAERQAAAERQAELERQLAAEREAAAEQKAAAERAVAEKAAAERLAAEQRAAAEKAAADKATAERLAAQQRAAAEKAAADKVAAERLAAQQRAAAEKAAADKAAAERFAAEQRAVAEKAAADKAAAERFAAEQRAAAEKAAADKAAAERLAAEQKAAAEQAAADRAAAEKAAALLAAAAVDRQTSNPTSPVSQTPQANVSNQPEEVAISRLVRTKYVPPRYPRAAQRRNTTGWVDASFTVARDGSVHSIEIMESTPANVFDEAATKAISQWQFEPVIENGVPVEKRASVRMAFSLQ